MHPVSGANFNDGAQMLTQGTLLYLSEIHEWSEICKKHRSTAAIHTAGSSLQLYRLFESRADVAAHIRKVLPFFIDSGNSGIPTKKKSKSAKEIDSRTKRHSRLHAVLTQDIVWEGRDIVLHVYKFEPDPILKVELVLQGNSLQPEELPLRVIASLLRCHEAILPEFIAPALTPYTHHDIKFLTVEEHLAKHMPKNLYASECLRRWK